MKKIGAIILCIILCAACFAGCGSKKETGSGSVETKTSKKDSSIVGTWIETDNNLGDGYVFNADGTGKDNLWDLDFKYTASNGDLHIEYKEEIWGTRDFTYSIEDGIITLTEKEEGAEPYTYRLSDTETETAAQ